MRQVVEVVAAGETMVLGTPSQPGRLRHASHLELKVGGAESNLAIALSRLGISSGWVSYLGDDEPGRDRSNLVKPLLWEGHRAQDVNRVHAQYSQAWRRKRDWVRVTPRMKLNTTKKTAGYYAWCYQVISASISK